ncbi:MAG: hypothetical protein ABI051_03285 [Vicinamibacterales bacterium]
MTLQATCFVLSSLETGRAAGMGLLCLEARYGAVLWTGADRMDRRLPSPTEWNAVQREIKDHLPPGPLARDSACARLLAGTRGSAVVVQWLWSRGVDVSGPEQTG